MCNMSHRSNSTKPCFFMAQTPVANSDSRGPPSSTWLLRNASTHELLLLVARQRRLFSPSVDRQHCFTPPQPPSIDKRCYLSRRTASKHTAILTPSVLPAICNTFTARAHLGPSRCSAHSSVMQAGLIQVAPRRFHFTMAYHCSNLPIPFTHHRGQCPFVMQKSMYLHRA
jgi:hypothetical protein